MVVYHCQSINYIDVIFVCALGLGVCVFFFFLLLLSEEIYMWEKKNGNRQAPLAPLLVFLNKCEKIYAIRFKIIQKIDATQ